MKRTQVIASLFLFFIIISHSQSKSGVPILLQGYVAEEGTNIPLSCKLSFFDEKGKQVNTKTQEKDGYYSLVLNSGSTYKLSIPGYILSDESSSFKIQDHSQYVEITKDFKAKKIDSGMVLFEFKAFEPQDTNLIVENLNLLDDLQQLMRKNSNMYVDIQVSSNDTYFKSKKVKEYYYKGKRKRYKWKTLSQTDQLKTLLAARVNALQTYIDGLIIRKNNLSYSEDLKIIKAPKKKKKYKKSKKKVVVPEPIINNVKIIVSKLRKF